MKKLCLNLGCGSTEYLQSTNEKQWINIDKSTNVKTDLLLDVTSGLPYDDVSISEIHSGCMLEQLTHEQFKFVMNECHRVLQVGGVLHGYVPSTDPRVLHLDPMDRLFFQEDSFRYFIGNDIHWQRFGKNYGFLPWSSYTVNTNQAGIIYFSLIK